MIETGMEMKVVLITPEIASEWLEANTGNFRRPDQQRVKLYSEEIKRGAWQLNGESIKFSRKGTLLDGQHRLLAVRDAGEAIQSAVIFGIKDDGFASMDRGRPRSVSQWLSHIGMKQTHAVAAVARAIVAYDAGAWCSPVFHSPSTTDSAIIEVAIKHQDEILDAVRMAGMAKPIISQSILGTIIYVGCGRKLASQNETARWFCESLSSGSNLGENEPVFHLRNILLGQTARKAISIPIKRALTTLAWNKTVAGETVRVLRVSLSGPNKTKIPSKILEAD